MTRCWFWGEPTNSCIRMHVRERWRKTSVRTFITNEQLPPRPPEHNAANGGVPRTNTTRPTAECPTPPVRHTPHQHHIHTL